MKNKYLTHKEASKRLSTKLSAFNDLVIEINSEYISDGIQLFIKNNSEYIQGYFKSIKEAVSRPDKKLVFYRKVKRRRKDSKAKKNKVQSKFEVSFSEILFADADISLLNSYYVEYIENPEKLRNKKPTKCSYADIAAQITENFKLSERQSAIIEVLLRKYKTSREDFIRNNSSNENAKYSPETAKMQDGNLIASANKLLNKWYEGDIVIESARIKDIFSNKKVFLHSFIYHKEYTSFYRVETTQKTKKYLQLIKLSTDR